MSFYGREWVCGLYFVERPHFQTYLPRTSLSVHSQIIGSTSRSVLTQKFVNPREKAIPELRYTFPLYDGVSVVGFVCTVNNDRVIRGIVKERAEARKSFQDAVARGETAGLLEQLPEASDVFTTTIGNIPAGAEIKVELTYLGELKHDAEADGIRFTIPTKIAPRYGSHHSEVLTTNVATAQSGIEIVVDAEMPEGSNIKSVQSPSHPISVTIGNTSLSTDSDMSLQKASATLSLGTAELDKDFVVHVVATNSSNPVAMLETHPTIPNQRALMATLVPKFNLPPARPEIVFVCDRSGSMGNKIANLKSALRIFLKSLPLGVKFNICSFGSNFEFLFKNGSMSYDAASLEQAERYVDTFAANFGGTEMSRPVEAVFKKRYRDMNLEVFLLTDGEIWNQEELFQLINTHVSDSNGDIRLFTLGIGSSASHALIEGVARAGNGFAQTVGDNEKMNSKVLRMLKASLSPHVRDYSLEIKYGEEDQASTSDDDDFELVEKVLDSLSIEVAEDPQKPAAPASKPISLFDPSADADVDMVDASLDQSAGGKYSHVPPVAEPKIFQAPFNIPPLYPFNRTTVYLLLSAQSPQRKIKSVVLRGTSAHGPLELEIPVTVLAEKGETIHQLAAKKAAKELEEGRGWIYHATDVKEPGKLLKDKFEGRFSDMVEREAVRLGVTFQVGGKWCSFVAVEENSDKEKDEQPERQMIEGNADNVTRPPPQTKGVSTLPQLQRSVQSSVRRSVAPAAFSMAQAPGGGGGLFGQPTAAPPAPTSAAFGMGTSGGGLFGQSTAATQPAFGKSASASIGSTTLFGAACSPPPPAQAHAQQQAQQQAMPVTMSASNSLDLDAYAESMCCASLMPEGDDTLDDFDSDSFLADEKADEEESAKPQNSCLTKADDKSGDSSSEDESGQRGLARFLVGMADTREEDDDSDECVGFGMMDDVSSLATKERTASKRTAMTRSSHRQSVTAERADRYVETGRRRSRDSDRRDRKRDADRDRKSGSDAETKGFRPVDTRDSFEKLVSLQSFEGSWTWTGELLGILALTESDARLVALIQDQGLKPDAVPATALVLAFFEKKLGNRKDEWELLADKARDWLSGMSVDNVDELVEKAKKLF